MLASEDLLEPFHEILKMTNVEAAASGFSAEDTERCKVYDYFLSLCFLFFFLREREREKKRNPFI
jgi:hypothetical protein